MEVVESNETEKGLYDTNEKPQPILKEGDEPRDTSDEPPTPRDLVDNSPIKEIHEKPQLIIREEGDEPRDTSDEPPTPRDLTEGKPKSDLMRAIPFQSKGRRAEISNVPKPVIAEDEILIKVHCFGINFADTMARRGTYPDAPSFPFVPGYDVSGEVVAIGANVDSLKLGARVAALTNFGGYAEYAKTKALAAFELPADMSYEDGASIPTVFVTAYYCLYLTGPIRRGDKILIHAAAGGVGLALIQLAKLEGLTIYGTAGPDKLQVLKDTWGVDHCIDYRNKDFVEEIYKLQGTRKGNLDIIVDSVGGTQLKKDQVLLRACGRVVSIGVAALSERGFVNTLGMVGNYLSMVTTSSVDLLLHCTSFCGVNMKRVADSRPEVIAECLHHIKSLFYNGDLRTFVSRVYDWKDTQQALNDIESRKSTGKLVVKITE